MAKPGAPTAKATAAASEATPLIAHEESGISLEATRGGGEASMPTSVEDEEKGIRTPNKDDASTGALPSWSDAFKEVSPFLRPRDRRHAFLASLALLTVLLEKLITVLPPLAIRHAVDAISGFGSSDADDPSYATAQQRTAKTVTMAIVVYFLLRTLDAAVSALQNVCQRAVSLDAERRFASSLFAHLQVLGAAHHLERHAGELLRILSRGSDATSTIIDSFC
ncbi:hypothetical protein ACHAXT_000855 [Thalassiosira profunda]